MKPSVIAFDVNGTLSDLSPLRASFREIGAPPELVQAWFAATLRDGFALTVVGAKETFTTIARGTLAAMLEDHSTNRDRDAAVEHVMSVFSTLPVHDDVPDGVRALKAAGFGLITLTNGSADAAAALLRRGGVDGEFDRVLSVDDAPAWKPDASAYRYAAATCGLDTSEMLLVAAHPWDIDGAARRVVDGVAQPGGRALSRSFPSAGLRRVVDRRDRDYL